MGHLMTSSLTHGVRRQVLPNGLTVLVRPVHAAPVVAINTWVKAGYFHEPDDVAGMAHLFEHMFFKGSKRFPGAETISREVSSLGGVLNAGTIYDSTNYYFVLPREAFERGVAIQADAVIHPLFDPDELKREAEVVIEESNQKYDNPPAFATEKLYELAFREHRIRRWRIGDHDVLRNIRREDLLDFFHTLYRPENMIVTVVGDVDADQALNVVEREYAALERGELRKGRGPEEPPQREFRFREIVGDISQSRIVLGWHTPGVGHDDNEALDVLAAVLGAGKSSRLYRRAVGPDQAGGVGAYNYTVEDVGIFVARAHFRRSQLRDVEKDVFQEAGRLRHEAPSAQEVTIAREHLLSGMLFAQEEVLGQAQMLAYREANGGYHGLDRYVERVRAVTPEDVQRVARTYLTPENASLLRYLQAPEDDDGDGVARRLGSSLEDAAKVLPDLEEIGDLVGGDLINGQDEAAPRIHVEKLSNGVDLLIQEAHAVPTAWLAVYFHGGRVEETAATAGITRLTLSSALRGSARRSAEQLDRAIESLGSGFGADFDEEYFGLTVASPIENLPAAAGLLREVITEASFPDDGVEKAREVIQAAIRAGKDSSTAYSFDLFRRAFFGAEHPYGLPQRGQEQVVASLTSADLAAWYRRIFNPARMTVVVSGNVDPQAAHAFCEEQFGSLQPPDDAPALALPEIRPPDGVVEQVEKRPRRQSAFLLAFSTVALGHPDYYPLEVVQHILSGMAGRLFVQLRGRESLAYTVFAGDVARPRVGYFYGYLAGEHRKEQRAREGMLAEFDRLRQEPVSEREVERAKRYITGVTKIRLQTNSQRGEELARSYLSGMGTDFVRRYLEGVSAVTAADVQRVSRSYFNLERYAIGVLRGGDGE
jgi:zinc protease